ncbi:CatA-like O-acetyltransferase [Mucilaginibacter aquaedulcis]|uniref:CatA-like O-acetyltransferase n=1 Tax=Mucilaginibacter aquaedulcis TaxID=1187081 RepID=UPI0025B4A35C|nr:CatA-like O-acetyltransferase [Mucilaginibacter aquaedulcis]MDN3550834.1 CatA-like O-acetyltransferase [Mucilaginibacter aquaedulcis]
MENIGKYKVDVAAWKRAAHYKFFKDFEQPFFGICTTIDVTGAYHYCKTRGCSFFLYYLHQSLLAANRVPEFRLRIEDNEVYEYEKIAASVTVLRADETFGFAYLEHHENFDDFTLRARAVIDQEKTETGLQIRPGYNSLIHYSVLRDIRFSSMQHAQALGYPDSVPKIVFGKIHFNDNKVWLPVSVHAHHALCDGLHMGSFVNYFEEQMNRVVTAQAV